jgi:hypothetical protein
LGIPIQLVQRTFIQIRQDGRDTSTLKWQAMEPSRDRLWPVVFEVIRAIIAAFGVSIVFYAVAELL